jgi:uncharacterized membrane protein
MAVLLSEPSFGMVFFFFILVIALWFFSVWLEKHYEKEKFK